MQQIFGGNLAVNEVLVNRRAWPADRATPFLADGDADQRVEQPVERVGPTCQSVLRGTGKAIPRVIQRDSSTTTLDSPVRRTRWVRETWPFARTPQFPSPKGATTDQPRAERSAALGNITATGRSPEGAKQHPQPQGGDDLSAPG